MNMLKKAGLGLALGATALAASAPADAQRYYRGRHHGDATASALLGGIIGLGVGAAIASNNRDRYYDRGYYDRGYYYSPPPRVIYRERYYAPPPPPRAYYRGYYDRGYYDRGYAPGYYGY